jgi:Flp pilus assembly protein TadB
MQFDMSASIVLIGAAIAIAGMVGVLQPPGHRAGVVLALAAGFRRWDRRSRHRRASNFGWIR